MQNKKYILSLVIVFALFLSFGKVFADGPDMPNRDTIQNKILMDKYGASEITAISSTYPMFRIAGRNITFSAWTDIQTQVEAEYQKQLSTFGTFVQTLTTDKNSEAQTISDLQKKNSDLQNLVDIKSNGNDSQMAILQSTIKDLEAKNDSLTKENSTLQTELGAKVSAKTSVKVEPKKESSPAVVSVPVPDSVAPVATIPAPAPIHKGFWATILSWLGFN